MSLDISKALSDGAGRTFERNGLLLAVAFVVFGLLDAVAGQTLSSATARLLSGNLDQLPPGAASNPTALATAEQTPLALPVPLPVALGLVVVLAFVAEALRIVAVRTLVSDETDTIREEFVSHNLLVATLNGFVGGVVVLILVVVGLIFLIVPGIFLALSFFFVRQEIAVEDKNFVDALSASWELTSGNRLALFGLALIVFVIGLAVSLLGSAVGLAGIPILTTVVNVLLGAVVVVFGVSVTSRAYVQLTEARADDAEFGDTDFDDGQSDTDLSTDDGDDGESEWKYNP